MRSLLALLVTATLAAGAHAEEKEWTLRIKTEPNQVSIQLGGTQNYGSGSARIKGSGTVVSKARSVAAFSRVRVDGPVDVKLRPGTQESATVQADDNLEPLITTVVEGDTLVVGLKPNSALSTRNRLVVNVEFKQLQRLHLRGSGDAQVERVKGDRFEAELSGSGDLQVGLLEVKELIARVSGSGDLALAGQAETQDWDLSGSGDVAATSLSGRKAKARLSGSGDLRLGVCQELDAQLSGSGDLSYAGRPTVKSEVTGSGELMRR